MTNDEMLALARPIEGWMYDEELMWLFEQAKKCRSIAEIGVWCGRSTTALCCGVSQVVPPGVVYAIDHFRGSPGEDEQHARARTPEGHDALQADATHNLGSWIEEGSCMMCAGSSQEWAPLIPSRLDMVFIDGGHDYDSLTADLDSYLPKIRRGGLICGHDRHWPGVAKGIEHWDDIIEGPGSIWSKQL